MSRLAVAASSQLAADAGARVASQGGNAVDAAVAASLASVVTEPGVCSLGAGAFITIWGGDERAITIDGYVEMPGRGLDRSRFGKGMTEATMDYGGGVTTNIGYGTVGTPGAPAAWELASERYGNIPWRLLVEPAYEAARDGFPLSSASAEYFASSAEPIFGWHPTGRLPLFSDDGSVVSEGDLFVVADLAASLELIATEGTDAFYRGDLGRAIATEIEDAGGILTFNDLREYRALVRDPVRGAIGEWRFATNPQPAVGGVALAAMLSLASPDVGNNWDERLVTRFARIQEAVFARRMGQLDIARDVSAVVQQWFADLEDGTWLADLSAPSTVHTSAVDTDGLGCAITVSAGYGSGVMPAGTGIWMNNSLGEVELNRRGLHAHPPGTRLTSNMAPTVALRSDGAVLAIGSPGADRITTALMQVMWRVASGESLGDAVDAPRLHVELDGGKAQAAYEPGVPVGALSIPTRAFDDLSMFFGGVTAAAWAPDQGLAAAADPRRTGGTSVAD